MSVPRSSVPPEPSYDMSGVNDTADVEAGLLQSIPEIEELSAEEEADTSTEVLSQRSFSVGATLGRCVHWTVSLFYALARAMWAVVTYLPLLIVRTITSLINTFVFGPLQKLGQVSLAPLYRLVPWLVGGLGIYAAWFATSNGYLSGVTSSHPSPPPIYTPTSDSAPTDLAKLADSVLRLESALSSLSIDSARTRTYIEGAAREQALLSSRVNDLDDRVARESTRAIDLETRLRASANQGVKALKEELVALYTELDEVRRAAKQRGDVTSDKEARALLQALEERVETVEGGVKKAIELGKSTKGEVPAAALPAWMKDMAAGKTSVTIKSTDGKDVADLVNTLVESAVSKASRDRIARVDYAMYSGGGSIIPSLTSSTYEVKPDGMAAQILGMFTGQGTAIGRPPVTVLNHEDHNGHCWPFPGSRGQVGVMLAFPARITDFSIDHVAREVATDMRSAPRHMEVWGLVDGADNLEKYKAWVEQREHAREQAELFGEEFEEEEFPKTLPRGAPFMRLAKFKYNAHSPKEVQTFPVAENIQKLGMDFGIVVLFVQSNWGREEFTCLYRFRVHGERVDGIPELLPEDAP
jgi:SUN domain-containing protein 1/2